MWKKIIYLFLFYLLAASFYIGFSYAQTDFSLNYIGDKGVDADNNGLYEYIEVELDVIVPIEGLYVIETSELRDPNGEVIPVKDFLRLILEKGGYTIKITLDGRRIYASGKEPKSLDFISLNKIDYSDGRSLNNVTLQNTYSFIDFERTPGYQIGVKPGNWAQYLVEEYNTPVENTTEKELENIYWEIKDIEDMVVYIDMEFTYSDDTIESDSMDGYLEKQSLIFPYLIPAELDVGESFGQRERVTINNSIPVSVLGQNRTAYSFSERREINQTNIEFIFSQEYLWDRETGVMLRAWFNTTRVIKPGNSSLVNNVLMYIDRTDLIKEKTSLFIDSVQNGSKTTINVSLKNSVNESMPGETIVIRTENDEMGHYVTDSDGQITAELDSYNGKIYAEYNGTSAYSPAKAEIDITSNDEKNTDYSWVITLAIIIILLVALIFVLKNKSTV
jgi:hypothetical protein